MAVVYLPHLTKRAQFLAIRNKGAKYVLPFAVLQYAPLHHVPFSPHITIDDDVAYIGFTVTKKLGNAVRRNRIKRRLREVTRASFLPYAAPGHAYVIIGRFRAYDAPFDEMARQLSKALQRIHNA